MRAPASIEQPAADPPGDHAVDVAREVSGVMTAGWPRGDVEGATR